MTSRMAADRAQVLAAGNGDPLVSAEAARNLAVLARKAGWHAQAMTTALTAAASPGLHGADPRLAAERGLLIQSAAYTAARAGDRDQMRELTGEAAAIAASFDGALMLRDHGGGFAPAAVQLHRISAENYAGDPSAAGAAAGLIAPASLPTTERRSRYWTDTARAHWTRGHREDCIQALLAAECEAPQDIHARPAIRDLIRSLLISGRTSPELRGLASAAVSPERSRPAVTRKGAGPDAAAGLGWLMRSSRWRCSAGSSSLPALARSALRTGQAAYSRAYGLRICLPHNRFRSTAVSRATSAASSHWDRIVFTCWSTMSFASASDSR